MPNVICILALAASLNVRVGYEENYPMSFTTGQGQPSGLYVDLIQHIAEENDWNLEFVAGSWSRLTGMLETGEIDLLTCMAVTEPRKEIYLFPDEPVHSSWSILLEHNARRINSIAELEAETIAILSNDIHGRTFMDLLDQLGISYTVLECGTFAEAMTAVHDGRAICAPVPRTVMLSGDVPVDLVPQGLVWNPTVLSFAGNMASSAGLIDVISRSLSSMKSDANSVYYQLVSKWLSGSERHSSSPLYLYLLGISILIFIVFVILANRRLSAEIRRNRHALVNSRSLASIAMAAEEAEDLNDLCIKVAELLQESLKADNFYIAVHNPENGTFSMPVFRDETEELEVLDDPLSFTSYVFSTGRALMLTRAEIIGMIDDPDIPVEAGEDTIPEQYIAVPMKAGDTSIGVIAFQSYSDRRKFTEEDFLFVSGISGHIGGAVVRIKARDEVERIRKRQKMILDFDPTAIFLLDRSGSIVDCNRKAQEFAGLENKGLEGRFLSGFLKDSDGFELDPIRGHNPDAPSLFSCQFFGSSGDFFYVEGIVNSFVDHDELFHFVTLMDVTEKQILEREAMRNERLESIGLLAGGIAHDFNNILTGIMGSLSLLRDSSESEEKRMNLLNSAENAAKRARNLTGQLLTFAKGGSPIRKSVDTESLLRDVTEFVLRGTSILLAVDVEPGTWNLNVDSQQFSQVLQNIATNARQAMIDHGKLFVRARNFTTPRGELVLIEFEDTGPGIPGDIIENIFDPYFTTKTEGHGLGLATCFSIINRHGGIIKAGNSVNGGALFTLLVPASVGKSEETGISGKQLPMSHSGKILVLDDDYSVLETSVTMLETLGYSVDVATNGEEAVSMYSRSFRNGEPYTAVIMDLTIPGGFGGEHAVGLVLRLDPEAVVIVSSGYAGNDVMANYSKYGFRGVLSKPYTISELSEALLAAMGKNG